MIDWISSKNLSTEDKKVKDEKMCVIKGKRKFEEYKICLEATQLDNKVNCLEKNEIKLDSLKKDQIEFINKNKLVLKAHQRFKSVRHNVFAEENNKISFSSNDDRRMQ